MAEALAPPAPTYIVASDLTGVQPPAFAWDADDLSAQLRGFEHYCTLILGTPSFARRPPHGNSEVHTIMDGPTRRGNF